ncbi:MAG: hypothetical protein WC828_02075 [Thermoleophilia bacterium]|jgi:hypothetical protein
MNSNVKTRVLIITGESAHERDGVAEDARCEPAAPDAAQASGPDRAGPYHRVWTLAEELSRACDVILAIPERTGFSHPDFAVVYYTRRNLGLLAGASEVVICDRPVLDRNPYLTETSRPMAASLKNLASGDIDSVLAGRANGSNMGAGPDEPDMFIWRSPSATPGKGLRYYLGRLRYHLRTGGVRGATSRAGSLIKRKSGGKEKSE